MLDFTKIKHPWSVQLNILTKLNVIIRSFTRYKTNHSTPAQFPKQSISKKWPKLEIMSELGSLQLIFLISTDNILTTKMFKLNLEKAEEPEIKLPTSTGSSKKQESSTKTSTTALLTMLKPLTVSITTNCGKFFKRWENQISWPASWETYMLVRKQQLELDMEQQTGSK